MSSELTEVSIVLDRSGSMQSIKDDMEGGLWSVIVEQNGLPGRCRISLYQFDDVWEVVFVGRPSGEIRPEDCRLAPRGSTALNDAVVRSLADLEARVLGEPEEARPDKVVIVVITDGHENASVENSAEDARQAVARATDKYGWEFLFLAADAQGFEDGRALTHGTKAKRMRYEKSQSRSASLAYSAAVSKFRQGDAFDIGESDD